MQRKESSLEFVITDIVAERSIDGSTIIKATCNDPSIYELSIELPSRELNKLKMHDIRQLFVSKYNEMYDSRNGTLIAKLQVGTIF